MVCTRFQAHRYPPNTSVDRFKCSRTPAETPSEREPTRTPISAEWLNFPGGRQVNHREFGDKDPLPQKITSTLGI